MEIKLTAEKLSQDTKSTNQSTNKTINQSTNKTIIAMWQPSVQGPTLEQFDEILTDWADGWTPDNLLWHSDKGCPLAVGDWLYIVSTTTHNQGIAMVGKVVSSHKRGREVEVELKAMFHPDRSPILTINELKAHLKGLDWNDNKSLKVLTDRQSERLGRIWRAFITNNREVFKPRAAICEEWYEEQRQASLIDRAIALAVDAHSSDIDLDGNPTILHALSVGMAGKSDNEKIVGFLHDVVEDTPYTLDDIAKEGFDEETMEALKLLTHNKIEPYMDYIRNICQSGNQTAINVKINDIRHNLKRGSEGGHLQFAERHTKALEYIENQIANNTK